MLADNRALRVAWGTIRNFLQDNCTLLAAAIAFAGVLAFLFWIYTGLAIVLLGAQFATVLNGDRPTDAPG